MTVIDAHCNLGEVLFFGKMIPLKQALMLLDEAEIDKVVAVSVKVLHYHMTEGNNEMGRWMKQHPDRIYGYCTVNPRHGKLAIQEIDRCVNEFGMVGVKINAVNPVPLDEPVTMEVVAHVAELGIPLLAHTGPQASAAVSRQLPDLKLIMAHMGNTANPAMGDWPWAIEVAKQHPNIYLETSGSSPDFGYIDAAVEAIGADRVLFGTDFPVFDAHIEKAKVTGSEISPAGKRKVLGENAVRLFGLGRSARTTAGPGTAGGPQALSRRAGAAGGRR